MPGAVWDRVHDGASNGHSGGGAGKGAVVLKGPLTMRSWGIEDSLRCWGRQPLPPEGGGVSG